jgi:two-component system phosphate regulon response regulator PhoB
MTAPTILVVEDEEDIRDIVAFNLRQAGFRVLETGDGRGALHLARSRQPDLVVLDLLLPDLDGREVCRRLREDQATRHLPVLMLTALASEGDRVVGFELGADDYLTKPFSPRELVLRVRAILRRTRQAHSEPVVVGELSIDPERHRVEVAGQEVALTATEFRLLHHLAAHAGRVQSREVLLERVWGYSYQGYARTVDTHVRRLRKKLGPLAGYIETVRGVGYRLREPA